MPLSLPIASAGRNSRNELQVNFPSGIKILHEPPDAIVDICFVHGLAGDRERTWGGDILWPQELLPEEVPDARILTFGYDAYVMRVAQATQNKIRDHARDLVNKLAGIRQSDEARSRPIIFIVHSLGGIVCKDALQVSTNSAEPHLQAIAALTRAILFAATPHEGSSIANWAKIPASALGIIKKTNVSLLAVLHTTSEVRDRIQDDFLSLLRKRKSQGPPLEITCLFETLETLSFTVVPQKSAMLPGYKSISVRADHRHIVRWKGNNSEGVEIIVGELKRWIEEFAMDYSHVARRDRCIQSLKFPQIFERQAAIGGASQDTCGWIFDDHRYRAWFAREDLESSHGLLWIKGKPGSGKSTLMKFLTEKSSRVSGSLRLRFFFNARGSELERSLLGLYRSLVLQLVKDQRSHLMMSGFLKRFDDNERIVGKGNYKWGLEELEDVFSTSIKSGQMPPLELFVDALDECDEDQVRRFVRFIGALAAEAIAQGVILQVCWASRHYPHISINKSFELYMEKQNNGDIQKFVHAELLRCGTLDEVSQFEGQIVKRARGVFLWVTLVVRKLIRAADQGLPATYLRNLLERLPTELDELLQEIFQSIDPALRSKTLRLIQWTLFSMRPLNLEELEIALGFSADGSVPSSLEGFFSSLDSWERRHSLVTRTHSKTLDSTSRYLERLNRYVTTLSGGLIEVITSQDGRQYLQVIHESVRSFLLQPCIHTRLDVDVSTNFSAFSSKILFEACRRFIMCPEFHYCLPPSCESFIDTEPQIIRRGWRWIGHDFTRYSLEGILRHASDAGLLGQGLSPGVRKVWMQLYRRWLAIYNAFEYKGMLRTLRKNMLRTLRKRFNGLLIEAGILENDMEADREFHCVASLHWVYLELKRNPGHQTNTAWRCASFQDFDRYRGNFFEGPVDGNLRKSFGHADYHNQDPSQPYFNLLELQCFYKLLGHEAHELGAYLSRQAQWIWPRLPVLSWAIKLDKQDVIRDLLLCKFDVEEPEDNGETPLCLAIRLGQMNSVKLLLSMGANLHGDGRVYETPLAAAAKHGRNEVLALLLEEIANWHVDAKEKALGRSLIAATKARHYSTMELLLRHGARVRDTDKPGRSALFYATQKKDRKATLLLLQAGAVTSDTEELRFLDEAESKEVEEAQKCAGGLGESSLAEK